MEQYRHFIENTVKPRIEGVPGVSQVVVNAGPPDEVRISVDTAKAASLGVTIPEIAARAASAADVSGGQIEVGRQQYELRYTGRYKPEELGGLVLSWRDGKPIRLGDVASIQMQPPKRQFFAYQNGNPAIGLDVRRATGALSCPPPSIPPARGSSRCRQCISPADRAISRTHGPQS